MESVSWDLLREEELLLSEGTHTGESGHYLKARDRGLFRKKNKNLILTIVLGWLLRSLSSKCLMN